MEYSIVHKQEENWQVRQFYPDGQVPWEDALAPELTGQEGERTTGRLRACGYCGSMHPADVANAIRSGAQAELADMKYGWPHKWYFTKVPNPHAGLLESRASSNRETEGWVKVGDMWREPGKPARATTDGKFYTVHLQDASAEDRNVIEAHLGWMFRFDDNRVSWLRFEQNEAVVENKVHPDPDGSEVSH